MLFPLGMLFPLRMLLPRACCSPWACCLPLSILLPRACCFTWTMDIQCPPVRACCSPGHAVPPWECCFPGHDALTVIRFLWVSAKFGTCTVVSVNGTQVEDKMRRFKGECAQFSFNRCPVYTHNGASAKSSTGACCIPLKILLHLECGSLGHAAPSGHETTPWACCSPMHAALPWACC